MIVLTIDPVSRTAGMLSIPRDMWVSIPGFNYNRINAAYTTGELFKLPGGGPALTIKTVEDFLGIPIQYYAQIDFTAFEKMIDDIGGICLNVPVKVDAGVLFEYGTTVVEHGLPVTKDRIQKLHAMIYAIQRARPTLYRDRQNFFQYGADGIV